VVVEPDTGLMPAVRLTKASGSENSDANIGADLVTTDATIADGTDLEILGDSAYATGDMLHALDEKKWLPLVKPWPLRPAVEGGFAVDDFTIDRRTGTATCPAGVTREITSKGNVTFGIACRDCPLVTKVSKPSIASIGRWSNAPSPGSPAATAECPTGASRRTTGSTTAPPGSTCADFSRWA
jgi:hypothetical protein